MTTADKEKGWDEKMWTNRSGWTNNQVGKNGIKGPNNLSILRTDEYLNFVLHFELHNKPLDKSVVLSSCFRYIQKSNRSHVQPTYSYITRTGNHTSNILRIVKSKPTRGRQRICWSVNGPPPAVMFYAVRSRYWWTPSLAIDQRRFNHAFDQGHLSECAPCDSD